MSTDSPLATVTALRVRTGGEVPDEVLLAALEDISHLARGEAGSAGLAWDIDLPRGADGAVPAAVGVVVLDAARRRVLNPDAYVTEQVGDYGYRRAEGTEGSEHFTDAELAILQKYRNPLGGLGTIQMTRPGLEPTNDSYYVGTNLGGDALPWSGW